MVWFELLSSRTSFQLKDEFWTPSNLNSEVSTPKILLFSSWYFMQMAWWESIGHLRTLSQRCPMLWIKVWRCPETHARLGTRPCTEPFRICQRWNTLIYNLSDSIEVPIWFRGSIYVALWFICYFEWRALNFNWKIECFNTILLTHLASMHCFAVVNL